MHSSRGSLKMRLARWVQAAVDAVVGIFLWIVSRPQKNRLGPIDDPILLLSARELAAAIRNRKVSSVDALRSYIARINVVDPLVNAVVDRRYSQALDEARTADLYVRNSGKSPRQLEREKPLLGVPVSVKSNIACKDMKHESGLLTRRGIRATQDADAVRSLREAGAIVLLTSNVPELSTSYRAYNKLNGHTKNPHDLSRTSGGSTGGESALISSGASLVGLGNDMCGSLRMPACVTGVFAHKPTTGIVSNWGLYPPLEGFTSQMLVQGPMTRYAEDLPLMMQVLAEGNAEKLRLGEKVDLKNLTFCYIGPELEQNFIPSGESSKNAVKKVLSYFQKTHGSKVKEVSLPRLRDAMDMAAARCKATAGRSYKSYLADHPARSVSLWRELVKYLLGLSRHTVDSLLFMALESGAPGKGSAQSVHLDRKLDNLQAEVDELLGEDCVLVHPSCPEPAYYSFEAVSKFLMMQYFVPFNVLGLPVTQCPLGAGRDGYPLGVQVVAGRGLDRVTLAVAGELEKAFGGWCKPCPVVAHKIRPCSYDLEDPSDSSDNDSDETVAYDNIYENDDTFFCLKPKQNGNYDARHINDLECRDQSRITDNERSEDGDQSESADDTSEDRDQSQSPDNGISEDRDQSQSADNETSESRDQSPSADDTPQGRSVENDTHQTYKGQSSNWSVDSRDETLPEDRHVTNGGQDQRQSSDRETSRGQNQSQSDDEYPPDETFAYDNKPYVRLLKKVK